jgi:N-acetylmuramoyl-L-alanine amidase
MGNQNEEGQVEAMLSGKSLRIWGAICFLSLFIVLLVQMATNVNVNKISNDSFEEQQTISVFSKASIKYGAENAAADVRELQGRLKYLGFFKGNIDGKFGWQTLQSLKVFQSRFGLKADGVAGAQTKLKLWQATKNWRPQATPTTVAAKTVAGSANHAGLSANDLKLMANAVYGEARGEPYVGQVAVAAVILNRLESASFPKNISGIIFQPGAFTAVADGQIWLQPNDLAKKAVQDAINGFDPSNGAIYYFNPETATSKWIWTRPQILQIGKHVFCN